MVSVEVFVFLVFFDREIDDPVNLVGRLKDGQQDIEKK